MNPVKFTGCSAHPAITQKTILTITSDGGGGLSLSPAGTGLIGGYIKIEMQNQANVWRDVTLEILNYGIGAPNPNAVGVCAASRAIIWLQRLRDGITTCSSTSAIGLLAKFTVRRARGAAARRRSRHRQCAPRRCDVLRRS